jgi:hypothetical protein
VKEGAMLLNGINEKPVFTIVLSTGLGHVFICERPCTGEKMMLVVVEV